MSRCWNCGTPYPGSEIDESVPIFNPETIEIEEDVDEVVEIESIRPCELEEMDFSKKLFAYDLLLNGEMVFSFCNCDTCMKSLSELLAFIMECDPEDEAVKEEIEKIDLDEFVFDPSEFFSR